MIVGGRATELNEGEHLGVFSRAGNQAFSEGFGFRKGQRLGANPIQDAKKTLGKLCSGFGSGRNRDGTRKFELSGTFNAFPSRETHIEKHSSRCILLPRGRFWTMSRVMKGIAASVISISPISSPVNR